MSQEDWRSSLSARNESISTCVITRNEVATIAPIVQSLIELKREGLVDRVLVVDDSIDGTAAVARALGAEVLQQAAIQQSAGPVLGKGDGVWRALSAIGSDIVGFVDGDLYDFDPTIIMAPLAMLSSNAELDLVKACFDRHKAGAEGVRQESGRVTEATARPLLRQFYPALAEWSEPLSGQFAARTQVLRSLPISVGYGVDVGLLIDVFEARGPARIRECFVGKLTHPARGEDCLERVAREVLEAIVDRATRSEQRAQLASERITDSSGHEELCEFHRGTRPPVELLPLVSEDRVTP